LVKIEISDKLYNFIMSKRQNPNQSFEEILESVLKIYNVKTTSKKKIVFVGKPEVGKSTIRECFFEFINPQKLIDSSLEPTIGIEHFNYKLYDLDCIIVDTSGQELEHLLMDRPEDIFLETNFVIFVVDCIDFKNNPTEHYDLLKKIILTARMYSKDALISMFVHKIDLIPKSEIKSFKNSVSSEHRAFEIVEEEDIPLFFTSIIEDHIQTIHIALAKLMEIEEFLMPNYKKFLDLS